MTKKKVDPHFAPKGRGEPKRDRWGRYLLPDPTTGEERAWTRVTTVSNVLDDRYNLELWAQRMVALGLSRRPDLLALVKTSRGNKRTLNRVVKDALEAGNSEQRANLGTALHAATESMDRGEAWEMPAPYDRDVETYGAVMDERGIFVAVDEQEQPWVERIVIVPALGVAGTLDRLYVHDDWTLPRVGDIKTGSTVHFSELSHAIQQSFYANSTHYWSEEEQQLVEMPEVDRERALIVHLPAGESRCELHVIDIALGFEAARVALDVREWRQRKGLSVPL